MAKLWDFRSELSARGFVFNRDGHWEHPKSGMAMTETFVDDVQKIHGTIVVEHILAAIDNGAADISVRHIPGESGDPLDYSWKLFVYQRTALDKMAKI
jgi:hypothetical protein